MKKKASIPKLDISVEHHQYLEKIEKRITALEGATVTPGEVVSQGLNVTLASGDRLSFQDVDGASEFRIVTARGVLKFAGNEQAIISTIDDPPKLRLGSIGAQLGAVSYNWCHPSDPVTRQYEEILLSGKLTEDAPASLGGQFEISAQRTNNIGDAGMSKMFIIGAAYTTNEIALVRQRTTTLTDLGAFASAYPTSSTVWVSPYVAP